MYDQNTKKRIVLKYQHRYIENLDNQLLKVLWYKENKLYKVMGTQEHAHLKIIKKETMFLSMKYV